jgi:hypothetical protein
MLKNHVPEAVIKDTTEYLDKTGIYRMDGNAGLPDSKGQYTLEIDSIPVDFHDVELAPPCGVMAANYSRAMHYEKQPHKYAMAWTTSRNCGSEYGSHFFVCQYGIRVQAAPNTLVIWQPDMSHGTSLPRYSPMDPSPAFLQVGMAIVTSNRIGAAWHKYVAAGKEGVPEECIPDEFFA